MMAAADRDQLALTMECSVEELKTLLEERGTELVDKLHTKYGGVNGLCERLHTSPQQGELMSVETGIFRVTFTFCSAPIVQNMEIAGEISSSADEILQSDACGRDTLYLTRCAKGYGFHEVD